MVSTRGKRAAASPPPVAEPAAKKPATRGKGKAAAAAEPLVEDSPPPAAKPAAKKPAKKGKAKAAAAAEPVVEDSDKLVDAQVASNNSLAVPIDDHCSLTNYRVYIDPESKIIFDASLNQVSIDVHHRVRYKLINSPSCKTNATSNANKFYRVQLLESSTGDYQTWTRWGRVGERGQSALLGNGSLDDALNQYDKKFKDKSGLKWSDRGQNPKSGKYAFIEKSYVPDEDEPAVTAGASSEREATSYTPPKSTLAPPVRSLMELVFNQTFFDAAFTSMNYDANKLPLGKLSKTTITRGFQALKDLAAALNDPTRGGETEDLSNMYYSLIPHAFGRNRPPVIRGIELLKKEVELLESLSEMKAADDLLKAGVQGEELHPLDSRFRSLGLEEMTALPHKSGEFAQISNYLMDTRGDSHGVEYDVQDIFRIERQGELDRFTKSPYSKVASDRRLLWHGSRATNYGGILSQGLRIAPPEAPVSGYMFDKGIYLADMSSKSAGYCASFISGGEALLLLCEAELGTPMQVLTDANYNAGQGAKDLGVHSTWGQGQAGPQAWKDATCVHPSLAGVTMPDTTQPPAPTNVPGAYLMYNEYICYDVAQVRLRYLLRVRM
ncbi:hypothetical protein LTR08_000390 [Meristemomyces frigidus]|nr:hypothetical protein LTR08_000390 [Meristemomyces frigidus]